MTRLLCKRLGADPSSATLVILDTTRRVGPLSQAHIWSSGALQIAVSSPRAGPDRPLAEFGFVGALGPILDRNGHFFRTRHARQCSSGSPLPRQATGLITRINEWHDAYEAEIPSLLIGFKAGSFASGLPPF
jgi:hypothetical protein